MKLLSVLFLMCVLLLSVRPCCADDCRVTSTDKKEIAGNNTTKENECRGCSPFFSCGTCAGFIVANRVIHTAKIVTESAVIHNSAYQHPFIKEITLSIWQPPQIS